MPLRDPALPVFLGPGPWGNVKKETPEFGELKKQVFPSKAARCGFRWGWPLEGFQGDLRRTKALTIAERSTMTGYPVKHDGGLLAAVVMESAT